jgi:hypothetical protein
MQTTSFSSLPRTVLSAGAVLLVAIGFILLDAKGARATFSKEVFASYSNCLVGCDSSQTTCNTGCCGILFCRKGCLSTCQSAETTCQGGCSDAAFGGGSDGAFFDEATVSANGRTIRVGGPLQCPEGATADVAVTLTQAGSGAVATGEVRVPCPAGEGSFSADAHATGAAGFKPLGKVHACGTARIQAANQSLDAFQWCRDVTIVPEGVELGD